MVKKIENIGRKAKNLIILSERFPGLVPRFEVVEFSYFYINWLDIKKKLNQLTDNFITNKINSRVFEKESHNLFKSFQIDKIFLSELSTKLKALGFNKVSYRTSALQEDLESSSFAGQYVTFLDRGIESKTIEKCVLDCAKSLFSPRALGYIKTQEFSEFNQDGSIIIQEMFYGKASGVLFTENGFNQMDLAYTLSSRNITVEGAIANNFIIDKTRGSFKPELPNNLPRTIFEIIQAARILEKQEGKPMDIEWAVTNKKAALLQFRPITTPKLDYTIEWDNTNIAESYPGITLPLTYTFIKNLYTKVYPEFLKLLGKTDAELADKTQIFDNMLGYMHGRVYYNINNWYKLIALLPGFKYNKDFFEAMLMPVKKKQNQKVTKISKSLIVKINLIINAVRFIWLLLQTNKLSDKFTKNYLSHYNTYKSVLWDNLTAIEILNTFNNIERNLLQQWAIPILNDVRTMVFHGILKKVFFPKDNGDLYIRLLSGIYDHTSVEPIRKLGVLTQQVKKILSEYKRDQNKTAQAILIEKRYASIRLKIENYIKNYGGRSPDELKLENPRLTENLSNFVKFVVSSAASYSDTNNLTVKKDKDNLKNPAKNLLMKQFFNFIIYSTKSGLSKRERFRFYRAQVFGIARDVYLALGKRFAQTDLIESTNDIFYLTVNEIQAVILGHSFEVSFKIKIRERKKIFTDFAKQNMGRRIISSGIIAPLNIITDPSLNKTTKDELKGLGVSQGVFQGKVIIVKEFDPKINVEGRALVTEHTDPGWTLLFLNAGALIVERGNALSHASIVAREIGIPAVVAVEDACNRLKDAQNVIVNGSTGEITVL